MLIIYINIYFYFKDDVYCDSSFRSSTYNCNEKRAETNKPGDNNFDAIRGMLSFMKFLINFLPSLNPSCENSTNQKTAATSALNFGRFSLSSSWKRVCKLVSYQPAINIFELILSDFLGIARILLEQKH